MYLNKSALTKGQKCHHTLQLHGPKLYASPSMKPIDIQRNGNSYIRMAGQSYRIGQRPR